MVEEYRQSFSKFNEWSKTIDDFLRYKSVHFNTTEGLDESSGLYFAAGFVGSGKQDYVVQFGNEFHFNSTLVNIRTEELNVPIAEEHKVNLVERNPNVFAAW